MDLNKFDNISRIFISKSLILFIVSKNHSESYKNVNSIHINTNALVYGIIFELRFGRVNDFLSVVHNKGTEQC